MAKEQAEINPAGFNISKNSAAPFVSTPMRQSV